MNTRFYETAHRLTRELGVRVEYAELNKEYIVDGRMAGHTARDARRVAREMRKPWDKYKDAE